MTAVPVVFELVLSGIFLQLLSKSEASRQELLISRELVGHMNAALTVHMQRTHMLYVAFSGAGSKDVDLIKKLEHEAEAEVAAVKELSAKTVRQKALWDHLASINDRVNAGVTDLRVGYDKGDKAATAASWLRAQGVIQDFVDTVRELGQAESVREKEIQREIDRTNDLMSKIMAASVALSALLALLLVAIFNKTTASRLSKIMANTERLAAGLAPEQRVSGTDELAEIDAMYHRLYESLSALRKQERAFLEKAAEAICTLDHKLIFREVNPAAARLFELDEEELIGRRLLELFDERTRVEVQKHFQEAAQADGESRFELLIPGRRGAARFSYWSVSPAPEDAAFYCVIQDITQRKQAERLKSEFVAMISHDLRTPLTSVQMALDWVDVDYGTVLAPDVKRVVSNATQAADHMLTLINNLLDLEKFESGHMTLSCAPCRLSSVIEPVLSNVLNLAEFKKIKIETKFIDDPELSVDAQLIGQVVQNLVGNAVKFSSANSRILIRVEVESDNFIAVSVKDEGPGISAAELPFVFERFFQAAQDEKAGRKGSGLGLAICRAIVDAHGGTIGAISAPGEGSTFWFKLPGRGGK
ncbi:MAG: PAS domain S-box protein [Cyanobacteria bacterium SZAS LIN-3]|nr:PAS domain S-box protein [Cyanobacteria bacterium SZAS LIN-3]